MSKTQQILLGVVALGVIGFAAMRFVNSSKDTPTSGNYRVLMDSESGEEFRIELKPGIGPYPHENPKTGQRTLFPTEICYAKECEAKGGTRVILDAWLGNDDPTHCPNCGSVVRVMNRSKSRSNDQADSESG